LNTVERRKIRSGSSAACADAAGMAIARRNKARPFKRMLERPRKRDDMKLSGNKFR
jgi:hypothetical protein